MSNPRNTITVVGRIPDTDKIRFEYINKSGEEDKGVFMGSISVRRAWKKKDDQYYPEDLIPFKAFGKAANYVNQYVHRGDTVAIVGELRKDDDYVVEGEKRYGQLYLHVDLGGMTLIGNKKTDSGDSTRDNHKEETRESGARSALRRHRSVI